MPRVSLHDALCWIVFGDDGPRYTSTSSRGSDGLITVNWIGDIENDQKAWDEAEQQLIAYLREDKLTARGRRGGVGEPRDIPEGFWHGDGLVLLINERTGTALYEFDPSRDEWREIRLEFDEVRRLWPYQGTRTHQKPVLGAFGSGAAENETLAPRLDDSVITEAAADGAEDPCNKRYWSRLQVEIWVYTRSREAVRWAELPPGRTALLDLDDDRPVFVDDIDLVHTVGMKFDSVCSWDDAKREVIIALDDGRLRLHSDPEIGEFCERAVALELWPEAPIAERPETEDDTSTNRGRSKTHMMLAEAVTRIAYGRELTSEALRERRNCRYRGRFPRYVQGKLDMACEQLREMIQGREVRTRVVECARDHGTGRLNLIGEEKWLDDPAFLDGSFWIDPCTDTLWTEPLRHNGSFNEVDRGYGAVRLHRAQFLAAIRARRAPCPPQPSVGTQRTGATEEPPKIPSIKRRKPRSSNIEENTKRKTSIKMVLQVATRRFGRTTRRLPIAKMAELLCEDRPNRKLEGYSRDTIRQILSGTYPAMQRLAVERPDWLARQAGIDNSDCY